MKSRRESHGAGGDPLVGRGGVRTLKGGAGSPLRVRNLGGITHRGRARPLFLRLPISSSSAVRPCQRALYPSITRATTLSTERRLEASLPHGGGERVTMCAAECAGNRPTLIRIDASNREKVAVAPCRCRRILLLHGTASACARAGRLRVIEWV